MFEKLKNLQILEKPEVTFKRQQSKNPYYPFEKTDENRKSKTLNFYPTSTLLLFSISAFDRTAKNFSLTQFSRHYLGSSLYLYQGLVPKKGMTQSFSNTEFLSTKHHH